MKKVLRFLDTWFEQIVLVALLSVMVAAIFYQVIMRYVFSNSPSWTEELTRYAFIWCIYFGVSYGVKMDAHIRVMAAVNLLPKKGQQVMVILADLLFLAFAVFILYQGVTMTSTIAMLGRKSPALEIPMQYIYSALPAGFVCIIFRLLQSLFYQVKGLNAPCAGEEKEEAL